MICEGCNKTKTGIHAVTVGQAVFNLRADCRSMLQTNPTDGKRGLLYAKAVREGNAFAAGKLEELTVR